VESQQRASGVVCFQGDTVALVFHPTKGAKYGLPGGKPLAGETLEACARRETEEETGLSVHRLVALPQFVGATPRGSIQWHPWYASHYTGTLRDSSEGSVHWITVTDLAHLPCMPGVCESVDVALVLRSQETETVCALIEQQCSATPRAPWYGLSRWEVLVGEVMSQQTQLARASSRWHAWFERWPTAQATAAEDLSTILTFWQGLGYPRRAKALWETAAIVTAGGWPQNLQTLPGVGVYTAQALQAFADREPLIPRDVNTNRVLLRVCPQITPTTPAPGELPRAIMEFGQTRCTRTPQCDGCPVAAYCSVPMGYDPQAPAQRQARYAGSFRERRGQALQAWLNEQRLVDDPAAIASLRADGLLPEE
jgi:A/G-specific adenine glycosylase